MAAAEQRRIHLQLGRLDGDGAQADDDFPHQQSSV